MNRRINHKGARWKHWLEGAKLRSLSLASQLTSMVRQGRLLPRRRNRRVTSSAPVMETREGMSLTSGLVQLLLSDRIKSLGRRGLYAILPIAVAVIGFATPVLGVKAYKYVMQTGHFYVKDVLVDGNSKLTFEDIRELASLQPNTHLLATNLEDMEKALESHDWVDTAHIQRELPNRLIIRVTEHKPVAYIALGELWLVNRSGIPFTRVDGETNLELPIITGLSRKRLTDVETRESAYGQIRAAVSLARLYRKIGLDNRWPIGEIHVNATKRYSLVLSKDGTQIELGRGPFEQKLYKLEWVLENLRHRQQVADYVLLDLSRDGRDDGRVIVKADIAPTTADKARESSQYAAPLPQATPSVGDNPKLDRSIKKTKKSRRNRKRRNKKNMKQNLPRRDRPQSASRGRGA